MKLASHYNKVSIIVTLSVLFLGAIIYFFAINQIAQKLLDDHLSEEVSEVMGYVNLNKQLPKQVDFDEDQTKFSKLEGGHIPTRFYDTVYNNPKLVGDRDGRAVEGELMLDGFLYKFTIVISKESTHYLVQIIAIITLALMLGLFLTLFLINRYFLGGLWKPFYKVLTQLKAFNITEPAKFGTLSTQVDEFRELDSAIHLMTSRVEGDYRNLKNFTENASHEMMTPLAVITSKLDTLIQDETLGKDQFDQIQDIYAAAGKLSRLNQSLLLLVKIENNLINDVEPLDFRALINDKIRQFQELLNSKEISITANLTAKTVTVSKYLIDILFNNFFSNSIRHNCRGGQLIIELTDTTLIFKNTGSPTSLDTDTIFDRFQKGNNSDGTGLGLTIVKNICNVYGWNLSYSYSGNLHVFSILF